MYFNLKGEHNFGRAIDEIILCIRYYALQLVINLKTHVRISMEWCENMYSGDYFPFL